MDLSQDLIKHLFTLSQLNVPEEGTEAIRADLERILDYISALESVDTEGVAPCNGLQSEVHPNLDHLREDVPEKPLATEAALNKQYLTGNFVRVPPVIEQ